MKKLEIGGEIKDSQVKNGVRRIKDFELKEISIINDVAKCKQNKISKFINFIKFIIGCKLRKADYR